MSRPTMFRGIWFTLFSGDNDRSTTNMGLKVILTSVTAEPKVMLRFVDFLPFGSIAVTWSRVAVYDCRLGY